MRRVTFLLAAALVVGATGADAQSAADSAAIRQAALDYIEGWYAGNAKRMRSALHPELAKRIMMADRESGKRWLDHMGAEKLVQGTAAGGGKRTPAEQQRKGVMILDIFENAASVRVDASDWIDYLHIAKWNERWVIVNVLWELRPRGM